jgi:hypothetical protein
MASAWIAVPADALDPSDTTRAEALAAFAPLHVPAVVFPRLIADFDEERMGDTVAAAMEEWAAAHAAPPRWRPYGTLGQMDYVRAEIAVLRGLDELWARPTRGGPDEFTDIHVLLCYVFRIDYGAMRSMLAKYASELGVTAAGLVRLRHLLRRMLMSTMQFVTRKIIEWSFTGSNPSWLAKLVNNLPYHMYIAFENTGKEGLFAEVLAHVRESNRVVEMTVWDIFMEALGRVGPGGLSVVEGRVVPGGLGVIAVRTPSGADEVMFDPLDTAPPSASVVPIIARFVYFVCGDVRATRLTPAVAAEVFGAPRRAPPVADPRLIRALTLLRLAVWQPLAAGADMVRDTATNVDTLLALQQVLRFRWIDVAATRDGNIVSLAPALQDALVRSAVRMPLPRFGQ